MLITGGRVGFKVQQSYVIVRERVRNNNIIRIYSITRATSSHHTVAVADGGKTRKENEGK